MHPHSSSTVSISSNHNNNTSSKLAPEAFCKYSNDWAKTSSQVSNIPKPSHHPQGKFPTHLHRQPTKPPQHSYYHAHLPRYHHLPKVLYRLESLCRSRHIHQSYRIHQPKIPIIIILAPVVPFADHFGFFRFLENLHMIRRLIEEPNVSNVFKNTLLEKEGNQSAIFMDLGKQNARQGGRNLHGDRSASGT